MNASDTYKSVVSVFSWSFNLSEMYIPKVEDRQMTTTSVLFLSHGDGYAVLSKIRFSFESLMTPAVGVLSADGAQLRAESPPRNCTELKGSASPPWFPRQHPASNDWLMLEYKGWSLQLQTFLKCCPSFRVSCETFPDLCCNCVTIQLTPLLGLPPFTPLWVGVVSESSTPWPTCTQSPSQGLFARK